MADEVVLIDLTPEALIARLRAGKVYPPERVPAALNNFFKIENLAALRETALRQVAEDVEVKRLMREPEPGGAPRRGGAARAAAAAARRRSPSGCSRLRRSRRTPSASCGARGARPSAWTPSSTCSSCARPVVRRAPMTASAWRRCGGWCRCWAPACGWRRARTLRPSRSTVARALGSTYVLHGHAIGAPRAWAPRRRPRALAADAPAARAAGRGRPHRRRPRPCAGRRRGEPLAEGSRQVDGALRVPEPRMADDRTERSVLSTSSIAGGG